MRDWIWISIGTLPFGIALSTFFDLTDWRAWVLLATAWWWGCVQAEWETRRRNA